MFYKYQKRQDICWEAKKTEEEGERIFSVVLEGILTLTAAVFFLFCVKNCLLLLFPEQKFPKHFIIYSFYAIFPAVFFKTLSKGLPDAYSAYKKKMEAGVVCLYALIIFFVAWRIRARLYVCSLNLFENYLAQMNVYYRIHLTAGGDLHELDNRLGILFWGIVIYLFFGVLGEFLSRKHLFVMPGIYFIAALLAVGNAPGYSALVYELAGIVIISFRGFYPVDGLKCRSLEQGFWKNPGFVRFITILLFLFLVAGIPLLSRKIFKEPAEYMMKYVPDAKEFQAELEDTLDAFFLSGFDNGAEVVDNKPPNYRQKTVFTVTTGEKPPEENQYFRNFYGMDYENGAWVTDERVFSERCRRAGYPEREVSRFLAFPANYYFKQRKSGQKQFPDSVLTQREFTLSYNGMQGGRVFLPYMLGEIEGGKKPKFEQDTYLAKSAFRKKFRFSVWDPSSFEQMTRSYDYNDEIQALYKQGSEKEKKWMEWYDNYVNKYYMSAADEKVPGIIDAVWMFGAISDINTDFEDLEVWQLITMVQWYLKNFRYNLNLDSIDDGMDPLEYFLSVSHEGYCVHFASAGVLLLRKMGIPARYAAGYVVHPGDWKKNADGSYTAKVLDSDAHAWAEVYFKGLGWIPFEMTPNGGATARTVAGSESTENTAGEEEKEEEEKKTEASSAPEQTETPEVSAAPSIAPATRADSGKRRFGGLGNGNGMGGKDFFLFGFVLLFAAAGFVLLCIHLWLRRKRRKQSLSDDLRRNRNRSAVCKMNRLIYKRLCRKRHILKKHMTDAEYSRLLQTVYPEEDWNRFMRIVKKASFSKDEVTEEEVALCITFHNRFYKFRKKMI